MKIQKLCSQITAAALLLLAISAANCTKKSAPEKTPPAPEISQNTPPTPPATGETGKRIVASLKKTPCYGNCPVFDFELRSDGEAVFHGIKNVSKIGKFRATASKNWQRDLEKTALEAGIFSMAEHYPASGRRIGDFPMTTTFLHFGEKRRRIEDNFDAPLALQNFESYFFEKIEALEWVKIGD